MKFNKLITPFRFKRITYGFNTKEKIIAILYYPAILLAWYGFYMWKKEEKDEKRKN